MEYSQNLFRAILRDDFNSFINKVFNTINPGIIYHPNWHIELIAEHLEAVRIGQIKRLIINLPPRELKSITTSVAWPAWILGKDPTKRIIAASYCQSLSIKHSLDCKFILTADWYNSIFPQTKLSKYHNQKSKFLTSSNGFRIASSVGGSITGEGGDFLIIDDPHNPIHINSIKRREKVIDWFEQSFLTRLNNRNTGGIVLIMQRLHQADLAGYLITNHSNWVLLKIPVQSPIPLNFNINNKNYYLPAGQLLHPTKNNIGDINILQNEIGKYNYQAQYLQEPIDNQQSLLSFSDISFYETLPTNFEYYVHSWDTAIKINENSDYTVCLCFGVINDRYYLIEAFKDKLTYPHLKQQLYNLNTKYLPQFILIEDKASGQQLIQDLHIEGFSNIISCKPKLDKITRFAAVTPIFQSGKILLPKYGNSYQLVIHELTNFPNSINDDIIDTISQFLNYMKKKKIPTLPQIRSF